MTVAETISRKVMLFPKSEQEKVLDFVVGIEENFRNLESNGDQNGAEKQHPLSYLVEMAVDMGVADLADRHDFYAHGKLED